MTVSAISDNIGRVYIHTSIIFISQYCCVFYNNNSSKFKIYQIDQTEARV